MRRLQAFVRNLIVPCGIGVGLALGVASAEGAQNAAPEITAAVEAFVSAGDGQSVKRLRATTHPQFRIAFVMAGQSHVTLLDREAFLGLIAQGKAGGDRRKVRIRRLESHGDLAVARVRLEGRKAVFEGSMTLLRDRNRWRVFQDAVHMTPRP